MMKTWVATDPSSSDPVVEHGDKKAAARLEKKKKQKLEREAAIKAPPTHRLIFPPKHARAPPVQPKPPLDGLISFFDEDTSLKEEVIASPHVANSFGSPTQSNTNASTDGARDSLRLSPNVTLKLSTSRVRQSRASAAAQPLSSHTIVGVGRVSAPTSSEDVDMANGDSEDVQQHDTDGERNITPAGNLASAQSRYSVSNAGRTVEEVTSIRSSRNDTVVPGPRHRPSYRGVVRSESAPPSSTTISTSCPCPTTTRSNRAVPSTVEQPSPSRSFPVDCRPPASPTSVTYCDAATNTNDIDAGIHRDELRELEKATFQHLDEQVKAAVTRENTLNIREEAAAARDVDIIKRGAVVMQREVDISVREAELEKRQEAVSERENAANRREVDIDTRLNDLNKRQEALAEREKATAMRDVSACVREDALDVRQEGIGEREQAIVAREIDVSSREDALIKREELVAAREEAVSGREVDICTREYALQQRQTTVAAREEAATIRERDICMRDETLEKRREALETREEAAFQRHEGLDKREEAAAKTECDMNNREEALNKRDRDITLREGAINNKHASTVDPGNKEGVGSFNVGWKRFGPQGRDISQYVPRLPDAPTVHWPTGLITTTPFVPDVRRGKRGRNKLKWDHTYVKTVARTFKSSRDRPDLCVHATFTTRKAAFDLITDCAAHGRPLVFDNFPDSLTYASAGTSINDDPFMNPLTWSTDRADGIVGANLLTPRDFQDAPRREKHSMAPYVTATLLDFHTWLNMPDKVRCILDLTCGFPQRDTVTERLADNVIECISSTPGNKYSGHFDIAADIMKTLDWFLLHTAGFLTFGHIDASGMATSAEIRGGGMKEWFIFVATNMPKPKPGDTRRERRRIHGQLINRVLDLIEAASTDTLEPPKTDDGKTPDWKVDGCIVELRPGMKYYQPAGTVHGAFTPVPTAAAGKHYFTYEDLHRMEVSRRVQIAKDGVTNHNHNCGVQLMLISMAAALPIRAANGQVFYRKPMIAMALMLVRPKDYIKKADAPETLTGEDDKETKARNAERMAEYTMTERLRSDTWAEEGTAFDRLAYTVATTILLACKTTYPGDSRPKVPGREYILEGDRWDDPGPPLDVRGLTDDLRTKHVDEVIKQFAPSDSESEAGADSDSDSDLTDLE